MTERVAIYTRVSTGSKSAENQDRALQDVAARARWEVVRVYSDHAVSGGKRRDALPAFKAMCEDAARRKFDLTAWSVERLGRSLQDLVGFLSDIQAWNVDMYLNTQAMDTSSPAGRALFSMLAVFAEFERSLIQTRVLAPPARFSADLPFLRPRPGRFRSRCSPEARACAGSRC